MKIVADDQLDSDHDGGHGALGDRAVEFARRAGRRIRRFGLTGSGLMADDWFPPAGGDECERLLDGLESRPIPDPERREPAQPMSQEDPAER